MRFSNTKINQVDKRNSILQKALRPFPTDYCISEEYPTVLNPNFLNRSYVGIIEDEIITHVNMWVRDLEKMSDDKTTKVAIVGNVATSPHHQSKGYMKQTLDYIESEALKKGCSAIYLWSDLTSFYEKLGYKKVGQEKRYIFTLDCFKDSPRTNNIEIISSSQLSDSLLKQLDNLRCKIKSSLTRSNTQFRTLMSIPDTNLVIEKKDEEILSFAIIGKGADLVGVVHEWGYKSSKSFLNMLNILMRGTGLEELMVIGPKNNFADSFLDGVSKSHELTHMAYIKDLVPERQLNWDDTYIWGLDSI